VAAAAGGGAGRFFDGLAAAALADKAAGRHALADLFAAAAPAFRLLLTEDKALEIRSARFTVVFINGHGGDSPFWKMGSINQISDINVKFKALSR
jgi:hypothetical protein